MKVYKAFDQPLFDMPVDDLAAYSAAIRRFSSNFSAFFAGIAGACEISVMRVSVVSHPDLFEHRLSDHVTAEEKQFASRLALGSEVKIAGDLERLMNAVFMDQVWCKLRDDGCRFIQFGYQDPLVYFCLRHDDLELVDVRPPVSFDVEEFSDLVIRTDLFDI